MRDNDGNLSDFLKKVDEHAAKMDKEQLAAVIRQLASWLPPESRERCLNSMKAALRRKKQESEFNISQLLQQLQRVNDGSLFLFSKWNEEEFDFTFEDPDGIAELVQKAMNTLHNCLLQEEWREAWPLAKKLSELSVTVMGDYSEYSDSIFSINEFGYYELLADVPNTMIRFHTDALIIAWHALQGEERCEELFKLFSICEENITFELLLGSSPREFPDLSDFLREWISFLGEKSKNDSLSNKLFEEAILMCEDKALRLSTAKRYANERPNLYERLLRENPDGLTPAQMLALGQEALTEIKSNSDIRRNVALLTAGSALRSEAFDEAERCWLEAFRSVPDTANYLRLCVESRDFSKYRRETAAISEQLCSETQVHSIIKKIDQCAIIFFQRDFNLAINKIMCEQKDSGWPLFLADAVLLLFLMFLYNREIPEPGLKYICRLVVSKLSFSAEKYAEGLLKTADKSDSPCFWSVFRRWRLQEPVAEDFCKALLPKLESLIERRINGIMSNNLRKQYEECAALIAAAGEIKVSWGDTQAKQTELQNYRVKYRRHSAFHRELIKYGMK